MLPHLKNRPQSCAVWFQPLASTSWSSIASTAGDSSRSRSSAMVAGAATGGSVFAIARLELGRLAVQALFPGDPIGHPGDLPQQGHTRISEQALRLAGVHQPGSRGLLAGDRRRLAETTSE